MGRTADPWRIVDARDRRRGINRRQVYGPAPPTTVPRLEDFPAQSRCRDRVHRSVRSAHNLVQAALWPGNPSPRSQAVVSIRVTNNPTAEWIAGQVTDAFPWNEAPRHLLRDRDGAFGPVYTRRIRAMRIRDHPTAPRSPWQNGHVERVIGSIRRESLDHLIVFDEAHLRRVLKNYASYYKPGPDASLIAKECTGFSAPAKARPHRSDTDSRRTPSSIRPGLGFD